MVQELFGVTIEPWQEEALEQFRKQERLALIANKGPGKSTVLAWCAWNFLLTRPYPKVVATSISGDNLRDGLWSEMAKWRAKSDLLSAMFEWTSTRIFNKEKPENWWMSARTWPRSGSVEEQANTLAGIHDDYILFLIDEAGGVPISVTAAAEAALTGGPKEAHLVLAGNPTSITGPLYKAHENKNGLWYTIHITGDPDNPKRSRRMTVEYAKAQIAEYGRNHPYVLVNIFGEFPPSNFNSLIGVDEVRAAMRRYYRPFELEQYAKIIGVDIAREGDDETVFAFRHGRQVFPLRTFRNIMGDQGSQILNREIERWQPDGLFLDGTGGWGSSWEDHLRALGRNPVSIKFNASPHEKLRFENKRAEMYWDMCNWIRSGGALPPDEELLRDLTETTYTIPKDVVILEPKKDIKARLRRSVDRADALALTFAEPVAIQRVASPAGRRMAAEYDPFSGLNEGMDRGKSRAYASDYDPFRGA